MDTNSKQNHIANNRDVIQINTKNQFLLYF